MNSEELKTYLESNNIEIKTIEFPKKGDEEMTPEQVKADPLALSDMFISLFNQFRRDFSGNNNLKKEIGEKKKIAVELVGLKSYKFKDINFGKSSSVFRLTNYVKENYFEIVDFFDLCLEVYE